MAQYAARAEAQCAGVRLEEVGLFVDRLESAVVIRQLSAPRGECEVLPSPPPAAGWLPGAYVGSEQRFRLSIAPLVAL